LTRIENRIFSGSGLQLITVPTSVEFLGSKCFSDCYNLLYVNLSFGFGLESTKGKEYKLTRTTQPSTDQFDELREELGIDQKCKLLMNGAKYTD
jgi:hypothetical protein